MISLPDKKQLSLEELADIPFEQIWEVTFYDQNHERTCAIYSAFRSLEELKLHLHEKAKSCKIYVYDLYEYYFGQEKWYYIRCAFSKNPT